MRSIVACIIRLATMLTCYGAVQQASIQQFHEPGGGVAVLPPAAQGLPAADAGRRILDPGGHCHQESDSTQGKHVHHDFGVHCAAKPLGELGGSACHLWCVPTTS